MWETLIIAGIAAWQKNNEKDQAQGNPALALAAQRRASTSTDQSWIVATGGSKVTNTTTRQDLLAGVSPGYFPGTESVNTDIATAGIAGGNATSLAIGGVILVAYLLAKK